MDRELKTVVITPQPRAMNSRDYESLATSRRNLVRTYDRRRDTWSLTDVDTGTVYVLARDGQRVEADAPSVVAGKRRL